jgi:hypothetical protein
MKKLDGWILATFAYGFPLIAIIVFFMGSRNPGEFARTHETLNSIKGSLLAVWLTCSFYIGVRLVVSEGFREETLTKLVMMRENDEREEILTGKATRAVFLSNLGILLFALLLSAVTVRLEQIPPEKRVDGKGHVLAVGLTIGSPVSNSPESGKNPSDSQGTLLIDHQGISISSPVLIFLAILWQILIYNISIRKLLAGRKSHSE